MNKDKEMRKLNCAIYTRKSTEEGLDQDFNTLDAQRESAESYIKSQEAEGWVCLPDHYDGWRLYWRQYGSPRVETSTRRYRGRQS